MNQLTPRKVSDSLFASLAIIGLAEELAHRKESGSPVGKLSASRWRNRPRSERMSVNKIAIWIQTDQRRPWNTGRCYTSLHYCLHDNTRPCGSYRQILRPHCHHRNGEPRLFLSHWKFCGAFHQRSGGCGLDDVVVSQLWCWHVFRRHYRWLFGRVLCCFHGWGYL